MTRAIRGSTMGTMAERRVTDGGRKLRAYIDKNYVKGGVPRFCEENEIDRISVQRALNGERQRISVDLATQIEKATAGAVQVQSWASWTGRVEKQAKGRARKAA